ncbi:MAG: nucleotide-diphospho-sugar transferase [Almyronema sp.]
MVVCIAESRLSEEIAIKLLLLSLQQHCPDLPVVLFYPPASSAFQQWLAPFAQVQWRDTLPAHVSAYDIKPYLLSWLLQEGYPQVWWIDADIILTQDFRPSLGSLAADTLVVTEEALYGHYADAGYRAKAWGFEVGRQLPFTLNTGVVRVTPAHSPLLDAWKAGLESDRYRAAQALPIGQRPFYLFGDQDVLTALLSSQAFATVPLKILRRGKEIIQYFGPPGYTLSERLGNFCNGLPAFIHSQGEKPWRYRAAQAGIRRHFDQARLELSPYVYTATRYKGSLPPDDLAWLAPQSRLGKGLKILGLGQPALTGLPLAALYSVLRLAKRLAGVRDRFDPAQAYRNLQAVGQSPFGVKDSV